MAPPSSMATERKHLKYRDSVCVCVLYNKSCRIYVTGRMRHTMCMADDILLNICYLIIGYLHYFWDDTYLMTAQYTNLKRNN